MQQLSLIQKYTFFQQHKKATTTNIKIKIIIIKKLTNNKKTKKKKTRKKNNQTNYAHIIIANKISNHLLFCLFKLSIVLEALLLGICYLANN